MLIVPPGALLGAVVPLSAGICYYLNLLCKFLIVELNP